MKSYRSNSEERPPEWDLISSQTTVYHNKNITEIHHSEDSTVSYEYDVDQYTRAEYLPLLREQIESENLVTMEAVAEIYEMLMGGDA